MIFEAESECYLCGEPSDPLDPMGEYFDGDQSRVAHAQCIVDAGLSPA